MTIISPLLDLISEAQSVGIKRGNWKKKKIRGHIDRFITESWGLLTQCGRVWVLVSGVVHQALLQEAHKSMFSIHHRAIKIHRDLRIHYFWPCMKKEIASFVERC